MAHNEHTALYKQRTCHLQFDTLRATDNAYVVQCNIGSSDTQMERCVEVTMHNSDSGQQLLKQNSTVQFLSDTEAKPFK
eukprot:5214314-Amphidinium_carterae.1